MDPQASTPITVDDDTPPNAAMAGSPARPGSLWSALRPLVLRLHFYAGVLAAPFILVAAITGLVYTITPQLEQMVYHHELVVPVGSTTVALSDQVTAARQAHPVGDLLQVDAPEAADRSTRVVFSDPDVPADYAISVFVDPYTGQVLGQVQSMGQWLGVRAWIDELHRNLHLGVVGRMYSEFAASWMWVVILGGLALWLGRRRRTRRARAILLPDRQAMGRARSRSWHASVGTWVAVGLLLLSISGLTWSRFAGANIGIVRDALAWQSPALTTTLDGGTDAADDEHHDEMPTGMDMTPTDAVLFDGVGINGVYDTARAQGLGNPLYLVPPAGAGEAWTAAENKRSWPTSYDAIAVDPATGDVVDRVNFADWPFMAKMTDWVIGVHMGILFGIANQIVLAALAIGLIAVIVQGYRMWWHRRPTRAGREHFGPPPARGAWRRVKPGVLVLIGLVTLVVSVAAPLLGVSLVLFLIIDNVLALRKRRARRTEVAGV